MEMPITAKGGCENFLDDNMDWKGTETFTIESSDHPDYEVGCTMEMDVQGTYAGANRMTVQPLRPPQCFPSLEAVRTDIESVIRGKRAVVDLALTTVLARGHLLIQDVPGAGDHPGASVGRWDWR